MRSESIERIRAFAGLDTPPAVEAAVRAQMGRTVQHKYGRHVYDALDFGLDDARIEAEFGFYRERYGIPFE